jgi:hypothetical protein
VVLDWWKLPLSPAASSTFATPVSVIVDVSINIGWVQVTHVQKAGFPCAQIDKGSLDSRKDSIYPPKEDITNQPALVRPVKHQLDELLVF